MKNIDFTAVAMTILLTAIPLAVLAKLYLISQEGTLTYTNIIMAFVILSILRLVTSFRSFKRGVLVGTRKAKMGEALIKALMQHADEQNAKEQE